MLLVKGSMPDRSCQSMNGLGEHFLTISRQCRGMDHPAPSSGTDRASSCLQQLHSTTRSCPPRLSELAARLVRTIGLARALVQGGRQLDLTGIDDGIGVLCAQTLDLPPDQAAAMLPLLWDMREQVDWLATALRTSEPTSLCRPC